MVRNIMKLRVKREGFTLIEIMIALVISFVLTGAVYSFFASQNHAYSVQEQVVQMEQNSRAAMDMVRRELRMAGYNAMGTALVNNLSNYVPADFVPTSPLAVVLDANPKITKGAGTDPDMITFLSVLKGKNNPTTFSDPVVAGATEIKLSLSKDDTDTQYNVGDILHIGTCSEYATVTAIDDNKLTIDTIPATDSVDDGLAESYPDGAEIGEISVVSYAVYDDDSGNPVLWRKVNAGNFQPVSENITDMQISDSGSGEITLAMSSRTDKRDNAYSPNSGYRALDVNTKIKIRNADTVTVAENCTLPGAPANLSLFGLDASSPCEIDMTWDPVDGSGCTVTGYRVYYDDEPGVYGNSIDYLGSDQTYTLVLNSSTPPPTPLNACKYYVSVAAITEGGLSPKSTEVEIQDTVPPVQPTGLSATNVNGVDRQVVLKWTANTDCDLNGYNIYRNTTNDWGNDKDYEIINTSALIPKEFTVYTDNSFDPIDCNTYYYKIAAVDYCPANISDLSVSVSAAPTAPEPPEDGTLSSTTGSSTTTLEIKWKPSPDDIDVDGQNYVQYYNVYGDDTLLDSITALSSSDYNETTNTYTYSYSYDNDSSPGYASYYVSAIGHCFDLESTKLQINTSCINAPIITIQTPSNLEETVSGSQDISFSATPDPVGRTISTVQLKIDSGDWVDFDVSDSSSYTYTWDTTLYSYGEHTITIKAVDDEDCFREKSFVLNVDNTTDGTGQLFCKLYACKESGNEYIYMLVYVYDQNDNPVSEATVTANINFGSGSGAPDIAETTTADGYYGGTLTPSTSCGGLRTDDYDDAIYGDGLSTISKSKYKDDEIPQLSITVAKTGYVSSSCSRTIVLGTCAQKPSLSITSPDSGAIVSGAVSIEGAISVPDERTLPTFEIEITDEDNASVESSTLTYFDNAWSYDEWDTTSLSKGDYYINLNAVDSEGCENNTVGQVTVDNCVQSPTLTITSSLTGDLSNTVSISGGATTPYEDRTISSIQMQIDNSGDWDEIASGTSWTYDWDTTAVLNGEHYIDLKALDNLDCESELTSMTVTVENEASDPCDNSPTISIPSPLAGDVSGIASISGTATGYAGRTISIKMQIDGAGDWNTIASSTNWTYDWDTTVAAVSNGVHSIALKAVDDLFCESAPITMSITVNNPKLFCTIDACKKSSGSKNVYMIVYVYDQAGNPVTGATVETEGVNFNAITEYNSFPGYYGGSIDSEPDCTLVHSNIPPTKSISKYNPAPSFKIKVSKTGFQSSSCEW